MKDKELFRLPARFLIGAIIALVFMVTATTAWPHRALFALGLLELVALPVLVGCGLVVSVGDEGVVLYRLWCLPWSRVVAARRVSIFGLPYILVERRQGFSWWVPLYFRGSRPMEAALMARAPEGNPLRTLRDQS